MTGYLAAQEGEVSALPETHPHAAPGRVPKTGGIAADQLRSVIERLERLQEEKQGIADDIKDLFTEAKGNGLDVPTIKKIIKLRAMDAAERDEAEHMLDTYKRALGMQPDLFDNNPQQHEQI
jgi:uncharacterized protein (UPF0335 family)